MESQVVVSTVFRKEKARAIWNQIALNRSLVQFPIRSPFAFSNWSKNGLPLLACGLLFSQPGFAADVAEETIIRCTATGGHAVTQRLARPNPANRKTTPPKFSPWTLNDEGLALNDRVTLFWRRSADNRPTLRVAIDGPVSKPAQLLSITDDTVAAVVLTSDQDTTRTWSFSMNFAGEDVVATAMISNRSHLKAQLIVLQCTFEHDANAKAAQAADSWTRNLTNK